jgi:hypothetical protein
MRTDSRCKAFAKGKAREHVALTDCESRAALLRSPRRDDLPARATTAPRPALADGAGPVVIALEVGKHLPPIPTRPAFRARR